MGLLFSQLSAHVVDAAIELELPRLIADETVTVDELAARTNSRADVLVRVLRALVALGLLDQVSPDAVRLTETGALLRPDRPDSILSYVQLLTPSSVLTSAWRRLGTAVRTGNPVFADIYGTDFFDYVSNDVELADWFSASMRQGTLPVAAAVSDSYDFAGHDVVMDVGGGDGTMLARLLATHDHLKAVLFDIEEGLGEAARILAAQGVSDRCDIRVGDFFVDVPTGADLYLLKNVLHDWDDERATAILANCRRVVPDGGAVVIIEALLPESPDSSVNPQVYLSDLNVLVNLGGKERTLAEFGRLCSRAGFDLAAVRPIGSTGKSLIEARPVRSDGRASPSRVRK
jgi:SAM-dependent methyltransferase